MPLEGKEEFVRDIEATADRLVRALALEAAGRLVKRTPVDTARARNNWNLATGAPDTDTSRPGTRSGKSGLKRAPGITSSAGLQAIERARKSLIDVHMGDVIYITNSLPYIGPLNDGHSQQAPAGWIEAVNAELQPIIEQVAREINSRG